MTLSPVRTLKSEDFFAYDASYSWKEFTFRSRRWYLKKRLAECSSKTKLAEELGIQRTYLFRLRNRLLIRT